MQLPWFNCISEQIQTEKQSSVTSDYVQEVAFNFLFS